MKNGGGLKLLIAALNSSHIHTSLAAWRLKAACDLLTGNLQCDVAEYTINDNIDNIIRDIYFNGPDVLAFCCYIWNITQVAGICARIKQLLPNTKIILGGPEVSFSAIETMEQYGFADGIICGEGETALTKLISRMHTDLLEGISTEELSDGIVIRRADGRIEGNPVYLLEENFSNLPSPYTNEMLEATGNRIAYIESTRGCPFSCSYCLSSAYSGVRALEPEKLFIELSKLLDADVKLIKFTDRTFNYNDKRTIQIWERIIALETDARFHFEIEPSLMTAKQMDLLKRAPKGRIQVEAGIQTMTKDALKAVGRRWDQREALENIRQISSFGNIHVHVSLIAGLPYDSLETFELTVSDVLESSPHQLQLGFLKLLKGSRIFGEKDEYGYLFDPFPPYTAYSNTWMEYKSMCEVKDISFIIDNFWNSYRARSLLTYASKVSGMEFIERAAKYFRNNGLLNRRISPAGLYEALFRFIKEGQNLLNADEAAELLIFDSLKKDGPHIIPMMVASPEAGVLRNTLNALLSDDAFIERVLPHYQGMEKKKIARKLYLKQFQSGPGLIDLLSVKNGAEVDKITILFDTGRRDEITGLYNHICLEGFNHDNETH